MSAMSYPPEASSLSPASRLSTRIRWWWRASAGRTRSQAWRAPPSPMSSSTGSASSRPSASKASSSAPTRTRGMRRLCYGRPMHVKFTALTPELYEYLVAHNPAPDPVLRDLAAETAALGPVSMMQVSVEQGALLTFLG